jgi:hypothetical protein
LVPLPNTSLSNASLALPADLIPTPRASATRHHFLGGIIKKTKYKIRFSHSFTPHTMAALGQYLDAAARAVQSRNGAALAALLSNDSSDALRAVGEGLRSNRQLNLGALCQQKVPSPFDEIMAHHCQCLGALGEVHLDSELAALSPKTLLHIILSRS